MRRSSWPEDREFHPCQGQGTGAGEAAFGGEIQDLPAGHAAEPRGAGKSPDQSDAYRRIRMGVLARQVIEGQSQQAVAGQDAVASSNALCTVGRPRRKSSLSMAGRSSWTSE